MSEAALHSRSLGAQPSDRDDIWLTTVGIDVGSSTTHATFSRLHLRRLGDRLSSRFVPVDRSVLYESPIVLTSYLDDYTIDATALVRFVEAAYGGAGLTRSDVDTGAVILTGEAVKRKNARAISERLASIAGAFVCATAGPRLEAIIAAHGSGSVALSRANPTEQVLNVDIGGGTTKFTLIVDGVIRETGALSVGGRLVAMQDGRITRLEPAGAWFATRSGTAASLGASLPIGERTAIATAMTRLVCDVIEARTTPPDAKWLWVTPPLVLRRVPDRLVFSGGVAQYVLRLESREFGDLGPDLGRALREAIETSGNWPRVAASAQTIRATVLGASQYTIQVSGNTVSVSGVPTVPVRNVRVVSPNIVFPLDPPDPRPIGATIRADLRRHGLLRTREPYAIAFKWRGTPYHAALKALADGTAAAVGGRAHRIRPLILLFDGDIGRSIGELIRTELDWPAPVLCLDGVEVNDFDFIDIGQQIQPSGAFPVVVKSLLYPTPDRPR